MSAAAIATLAEARSGGFVLTVEDDLLRCRPALVPPDLLARLRANKEELLQVLTGNSCRRCGERMEWPDPVGIVLSNGEAEHHGCRP
jgi:hypothetical protein